MRSDDRVTAIRRLQKKKTPKRAGTNVKRETLLNQLDIFSTGEPFHPSRRTIRLFFQLQLRMNLSLKSDRLHFYSLWPAPAVGFETPGPGEFLYSPI